VVRLRVSRAAGHESRDPARRTGRDHFGHPALGRVSRTAFAGASRGSRSRARTPTSPKTAMTGNCRYPGRPACAVVGESGAPHDTNAAAHRAAPSPTSRSRSTPPSPARPSGSDDSPPPPTAPRSRSTAVAGLPASWRRWPSSTAGLRWSVRRCAASTSVRKCSPGSRVTRIGRHPRRSGPAYDLAIVTRGVRQPFQIGGGLGRLLDAYAAAGGASVSAA
jgi:hypothetical protein